MRAPTRHRGRPRYSTRSRNAGAPAGTPTSSFDPLTDITWAKLSWASDPDWTPPSDLGAVSSWRNAGSVSGDHTDLATAANDPTYHAAYANLNGQPALVFDGTNDALYSAAFTAIAQPWSLVVITYQGSLVSRAIGSAQVGAGASSYLGTITSGTVWYLGTSAANISGGTVTTGSHVVVGVVNGASSLIAVDGVTVATGTIGSGTATRTGIGVDGGTTKPWNGAISLFGLYAGDFTADPAYADFLAWA